VEALGDQLEVVDQRLHRLTHDLADVLEGVAHAVRPDRQLRGPGDLGVLHHDRPRLHLRRGLLDDLERLVHLGDAQPVAGVAVRLVAVGTSKSYSS
jgi:hypothetical protein